MPAFHPLCVLLQVHDRASLHLQEHAVIGGVIPQQRLQVPVELADTGYQRREVVLDLCEHEVDRAD